MLRILRTGDFVCLTTQGPCWSNIRVFGYCCSEGENIGFTLGITLGSCLEEAAVRLIEDWSPQPGGGELFKQVMCAVEERLIEGTSGE